MTSTFNSSSPTGWSVCTPPPFPSPYVIPSSPVHFNKTLIGEWNHNHTSTVALVYGKNTVPTPWPIYLAGLLISLGTAIYSTISGSPDPKLVEKGHVRAIIGFFMSLYQAIRAFSGFIGLCLALSNQGGHYLAPSAITCVLLSLVKGTLDVGAYSFARTITGLGASFAVVTLIIMIILQVFDPNRAGYYAEWLVVNGNCPRVVSDLSDGWECYIPAYVGCGIYKTGNATTQNGFLPTIDPNRFDLANGVAFSELLVAGLVFLPNDVLAILLIPFWISILGAIHGFILGLPNVVAILFSRGYTMKELWKKLTELVCTSPFDVESDSWTHKKMRKISRWIIPVIILFIAIEFPMQYVGQTRSTSIVIQDSMGNLSAIAIQYGNETFDNEQPLLQTWTGDGVNSSVWTDFFLAQTPADKYGFLNYWWNQNGAVIWHKTALM